MLLFCGCGVPHTTHVSVCAHSGSSGLTDDVEVIKDDVNGGTGRINITRRVPGIFRAKHPHVCV